MTTGDLITYAVSAGAFLLGVAGFLRQTRVDQAAKSANERTFQLQEQTQAFDEVARLNELQREQLRDLRVLYEQVVEQDQAQMKEKEQLLKDLNKTTRQLAACQRHLQAQLQLSLPSSRPSRPSRPSRKSSA